MPARRRIVKTKTILFWNQRHLGFFTCTKDDLSKLGVFTKDASWLNTINVNLNKNIKMNWVCNALNEL